MFEGFPVQAVSFMLKSGHSKQGLSSQAILPGICLGVKLPCWSSQFRKKHMFGCPESVVVCRHSLSGGGEGDDDDYYIIISTIMVFFF